MAAPSVRLLRLELVLGPGRGAQIVEPVEVRLDELNVHVRVEVVGGDDVEHRRVRHLVGVIERHAVRDAAAAVLSDDGNFSKPKCFITST